MVSQSNSVKERLFASLPAIELSIRYEIFPLLTADGQPPDDFFSIDIRDNEGTMAELFVRLEFRIFEYLAVGAAYDRLMLDIEYKSGKAKGWKIDAAWNGAYFYGALYF